MNTYFHEVIAQAPMHARPCAEIVKIADTYKKSFSKLDINLERILGSEKEDWKTTHTSSAYSIMGLMTMAIDKDEIINIKVQGKYHIKILQNCAKEIGDVLEKEWEY